MLTLVLRVFSSEMGPRLTSRRLPTCGVSSHSTVLDIPTKLHGASAISQQKYAMNHFIIYCKPQTCVSNARNIYFAIGLKKTCLA